MFNFLQFGYKFRKNRNRMNPENAFEVGKFYIKTA